VGQINGLNGRSNCLINNQIADKLSGPWSEAWGLGGVNLRNDRAASLIGYRENSLLVLTVHEGRENRHCVYKFGLVELELDIYELLQL